MTLWLLPIVVAALGIVGIVAALQLRYRRTNRLQLRVLSGRRRLLGEEITDRCAQLDALDPVEMEDQRRLAASTLDVLQTRLLDREAHLLNLGDLASLQNHKLAVLGRRLDELSAVAAAEPGGETEAELPADAGIIERRDRLEDKLLQGIQDRSEGPRRPPRRRRR